MGLASYNIPQGKASSAVSKKPVQATPENTGSKPSDKALPPLPTKTPTLDMARREDPRGGMMRVSAEGPPPRSPKKERVDRMFAGGGGMTSIGSDDTPSGGGWVQFFRDNLRHLFGGGQGSALAQPELGMGELSGAADLTATPRPSGPALPPRSMEVDPIGGMANAVERATGVSDRQRIQDLKKRRSPYLP